MFDVLWTQLVALADLGGPVVLLLLAISVLTLAVVLYKIWQFSAAGVGRHKALREAVSHWAGGDVSAAQSAIRRSTSYLAPVVSEAFAGQIGMKDGFLANAEVRFSRLERGFRLLDSVVQLAPLLGLFGTVLGMIEAFQALQDAGASVDPSLLAGGIWVALLTTAVGLGVAMPTSVALTWFESRMDDERVMAETFILTALEPAGGASATVGLAAAGASHG